LLNYIFDIILKLDITLEIQLIIFCHIIHYIAKIDFDIFMHSANFYIIIYMYLIHKFL